MYKLVVFVQQAVLCYSLICEELLFWLLFEQSLLTEHNEDIEITGSRFLHGFYWQHKGLPV